MDTEIKNQRSAPLKRLTTFVKKWKYPLLVLAIGAILVLFSQKPEPKEENLPTEPEPAVLQEDYTAQTERRLEEILSSVDGAGKVRVMLTVKGSDVTFYQTDTEQTSEELSEGSRSSIQHKTVIMNGSGEYDKPAVVKTEFPTFQGALIVSEGADNAAVRLALVSAVSSLLGLGTDKISVMKMN